MRGSFVNEGTITIGELAKRSGVAVSAIRFYDDQGLISSTRAAGGQRQYRREALRRVGFIRAAQAVGLSLSDIQAALDSLPGQRTPTKQDWARLSRAWQPLLQARIDRLVALRDRLASCVGCGCLSLKACALHNPGDIAHRLGSGPRYLQGDTPSTTLAKDGRRGRR
ncbi:redox-sensitive transcriptional activator SoxR [Burkholderia glumae]|uniref:Redox-sensitive transcriptional activator SoxR n=1 Tax=Burkholderia glumae TaxID=337 RepID=A0AAP9Y4G8_BURGL|nr:redox-sensitive transcriptional activator SoxR [Burkholderia glumae]MCM2482914.1 redox-sensitive transcriptional activator SoxR [Burkholderia glumae]MCM2493636.1 redox-sensitive transcriptional activator SoxR [Burkholderia glumae]MCM2506229.1 redox-sensitive transcriptional activator SoxR [Burkholderia glumae]MCM2537816.1 redox-sensitive transcriptional activator SoxR [Burkholderia glumae]MCM2543743.1 redox-sensitive transcriptional activator SoxR [Burkholderia glumae]